VRILVDLHEPAINKVKQNRAMATRYDCEYVWRGTVDVAAIRIWLGTPPHDPWPRQGTLDGA
jgi:hypothetical protein